MKNSKPPPDPARRAVSKILDGIDEVIATANKLRAAREALQRATQPPPDVKLSLSDPPAPAEGDRDA
jgi:hypothetical protein